VQRQQALSENRGNDAETLLAQLLLCKQRAGWPDFFAHGEALAWQSRRALQQGNVPRAQSLAQAALQLAPHRVAPYMAQMSAAWRQGHYKVMWVSLRGALGLFAGEAPYRLSRLSAYGLWLLLALSAGLVALASASLYRYGAPLWHDVWHKLPKRTHPTAQALLMGVCVLMPALLRLGPLSWALLSLGVLAPYLRQRERLMTMGALALLAGLLSALPWVGRAICYSGSGAEAAYLVARDIGADAQATRLANLSKPAALDCLALGLRARWQGNIIESRRWLERAIHADFQDATTYVALGNARWLQQAPNEAMAAYKKAIALEPSNIYALFNLSQVRLTLVEPQDDTRQQASRINHDLVVQLKNQVKKTGIAVAEPPVPTALLHRPLHQGAEYTQALTQLYRPVGGAVPRQVHIAAALGLFVYMLWLGQPMAMRRRTTDCQRCGDPICFICKKGPAGRTHCAVCIKIGTPAADADRQARIKKEIAAHRFFARRLATQRRFAWLLPGSAQLLKGESGWGLLACVLFGVSGLALLTNAGVLNELLPYYGGLNGLFNVAHGMCLVGVYVVALVFGLREEQ
jgi:tetratricopeptide (TPR) repeat protein